MAPTYERLPNNHKIKVKNQKGEKPSVYTVVFIL